VRSFGNPGCCGWDTRAPFHLGNAHDMSAADLARLLDVHRTLGAMILRGERQLTLAHVRTLAKRFSVSADLFLP